MATNSTIRSSAPTVTLSSSENAVPASDGSFPASLSSPLTSPYSAVPAGDQAVVLQLADLSGNVAQELVELAHQRWQEEQADEHHPPVITR